MSSTEQWPQWPSPDYVECECPAELLPPVVSPSLRTIFALSRFALGNLAEDLSFNKKAYRINMPPLEVPDHRGGLPHPMGELEKSVIVGQAKQILTGPYLHDEPSGISDRALLHVQLWLDGLADGMSEGEVANRLGSSPKHVRTAGMWLRSRLASVNQPNTMYSALLHGYEPDVSASPQQESPPSHYERLHLYLDAEGFAAKQAAKLTRPKSRGYAAAISSARGKIRRDFGASSSAQAIFFAFQTGHFKRLPPPRQ